MQFHSEKELARQRESDHRAVEIKNRLVDIYEYLIELFSTKIIKWGRLSWLFKHQN